MVESLRRLATRRGETLALVGGGVRDALRGRPLGDVDLALEGDAPALARAFAARHGLPVTVHPRFATATLVTRHGDRVDLATARRESYPRPGALPLVAPATLREDLGRRDFTVNAMAVVLDRPGGGWLLDPFGGASDLARGLLRTLHDASFRDDPTRMLRGLEFEWRFGLRLDRRTLRQARLAVAAGAFETLSASRRGAAVARLLEWMPGSVGLARRVRDLGFDRVMVGQAVRGPWVADPLWGRLRRELRARPATPPWRIALVCFVLAARRPATFDPAGLGLTGSAGAWIDDVAARVEAAERILAGRRLARSRRDATLRGLPDPALALLAVHPRAGVRRAVRNWRLRDAPLRLSIDGADLRRAGLQGPGIRAGLAAARAARLDRAIPRNQELRVALTAGHDAAAADALARGDV